MDSFWLEPTWGSFCCFVCYCVVCVRVCKVKRCVVHDEKSCDKGLDCYGEVFDF